jgi:hypothetical protein
VVNVGGELLLRPAGGGQTIDIELMASVPLSHKGKHLVVRRPTMEVAGRLRHHYLDIAAIRVRQKDLRPVAAGSCRGEGKLLPIRRDGFVVIAKRMESS